MNVSSSDQKNHFESQHDGKQGFCITMSQSVDFQNGRFGATVWLDW